MSVHVIYYKNGAKMMRPVKTREEYLKLRSLSAPLAHKEGAEPTDEEIAKWKRSLPQMNYSCLPDSSLANAPLPTSLKGGENKTESVVGYPLKGCKTPSNSVGMDVDILRNENENEYQKRLAAIPEKVLAKKEELGLLMLERSATKGYHLVFRRHPELSQEDNLRWASDLIGVAFDKGAKDITRVFFTTSASEKDLIYLDDEIFDLQTPVMGRSQNDLPVESADPQEREKMSPNGDSNSSLSYQGIPYSAIVKKWWELYNDGQEPCEGNRNTLTFELAVNLRHICGFDRELLNQVIPDYWTPRPPLGGGFIPNNLIPDYWTPRPPLGGGFIPNNLIPDYWTPRPPLGGGGKGLRG